MEEVPKEKAMANVLHNPAPPQAEEMHQDTAGAEAEVPRNPAPAPAQHMSKADTGPEEVPQHAGHTLENNFSELSFDAALEQAVEDFLKEDENAEPEQQEVAKTMEVNVEESKQQKTESLKAPTQATSEAEGLTETGPPSKAETETHAAAIGRHSQQQLPWKLAEQVVVSRPQKTKPTSSQEIISAALKKSLSKNRSTASSSKNQAQPKPKPKEKVAKEAAAKGKSKTGKK